VYCAAQAAEADPLRKYAAELVEYQNKERTADVLRVASFALGVALDKLEGAQLLWVDRLGIYLFAAIVGGPGAQVKQSHSWSDRNLTLSGSLSRNAFSWRRVCSCMQHPHVPNFYTATE
jgi:hypothetical protein